MITILDRGNVAANEGDMIVRPQSYTSGKYACLYVHGAESGAGCYDWMQASPYRWPIFRAVSDRCGLVGVSADIGGSATWGNATVQARLGSAFTYAQTLPGIRLGKVVLVGQSMGGIAALTWAKNNPDKVACIVGIIPVTNLTFAWASSSYTSAINAAYGGAYSEASYGADYNPTTYASSLAGINGQLWVGAEDSLGRLQDAQSISAAAPSITVRSIPGAHAEATLGNIDLNQLESFIRQYA